MNKLPSHVHARRGLDYGCPRYDADVWDYLEPPTERSNNSAPKWIQLDHIMTESEVRYLDEWQEKWGRR